MIDKNVFMQKKNDGERHCLSPFGCDSQLFISRYIREYSSHTLATRNLHIVYFLRRPPNKGEHLGNLAPCLHDRIFGVSYTAVCP